MINQDKLRTLVMAKSKISGLAPDLLYRNYLFERFLERLSLSPYKEKFIIKGGFLIGSISGIEQRATMDIDTTIKNLQLEIENLQTIIQDIAGIEIDDGVIFEILTFKEIREQDIYPGFRVSFVGIIGKMRMPLKLDIVTGDVIVPEEVLHTHKLHFENREIQFWGYAIETILAEKVETVPARGITNTRSRDYYDIYLLSSISTLDFTKFRESLLATTTNRNTSKAVQNYDSILENVQQDPTMNKQWRTYQSSFPYAKGIAFETVITSVHKILQT